MNWKGILLAGGLGTRLKPLSNVVSKHLMLVYDKPMIYYPLSVLMLSGIREILIICTKESLSLYKKLLGNGKRFGINLNYLTQQNPAGIPEAFILGKEFISKDNVCLVLGDNLFFGQGLTDFLNNAKNRKEGATIFGYKVKDAGRFGVVEFNKSQRVISIEEKPKIPKSDYAVTGLYFYDNRVIEYAERLSPSARGELEITDLNNIYIGKGLKVELWNRGFAWLDTGTHDSLLEASQFVQTIQNRQGFKIACLEEIAYNNQWISRKDLIERAEELSNTDYGKYLNEIAK